MFISPKLSYNHGCFVGNNAAKLFEVMIVERRFMQFKSKNMEKYLKNVVKLTGCVLKKNFIHLKNYKKIIECSLYINT